MPEDVPEKLAKSYHSSVAHDEQERKHVRYAMDDFTKRRQEADRILIYETYRFLVIMADMLVCLAHGSNDVANAISPLIVVAAVDDRNGRVPYYLGAAGISCGMIFMGHYVMVTVGKRVVKLDYCKGYCAQFSVAITVIFGSILKIPLSTTHCMVGGLFGLMITNKWNYVRRAYGMPLLNKKGSTNTAERTSQQSVSV